MLKQEMFRITTALKCISLKQLIFYYNMLSWYVFITRNFHILLNLEEMVASPEKYEKGLQYDIDLYE